MKAAYEFVKRVIDASDGNQSIILIEEIQKDARRNLEKELARIKACNNEGDKLVVKLKAEVSQLRAKLSGRGFHANHKHTLEIVRIQKECAKQVAYAEANLDHAFSVENRLFAEKIELKKELEMLQNSIKSLAQAQDHDDLAIRVLELTSRFQK